jgi:hypothetical protein
MDRFLEWAIGILIVVTVLLLGVVIAAKLSTTEGTVVNKYYDDPDLVCSKGCYRTPECWTIVVSGDSWYDDHACVDESEYDEIEIGDYFKEK